MPETLTMEQLFEGAKSESPESWDITWISQIKIPNDAVLNQIQAIKIMTETARAVEWCGEKIALCLYFSEQAKTESEKEWSLAYTMRARDKTAGGKKVEADADPEYLLKKALAYRYKSYLEFFKQKQSGFLTIHNAMKEIVRVSMKEMPMAGWPTSEDAYEKEEEPEKNKNSDPDDFSIE